MSVSEYHNSKRQESVRTEARERRGVHSAGRALAGKPSVALSQHKEKDRTWHRRPLTSHRETGWPNPSWVATNPAFLQSFHYFILEKQEILHSYLMLSCPLFLWGWRGMRGHIRWNHLPSAGRVRPQLPILSAHITGRRSEGTLSTCWVPNKAQIVFL